MKKKFLIITVALLLVCFGVWWFISMKAPVQQAAQTQTDIPGLPPDPGEAGKKTLAGIDSDNDGVRDDVERWIVVTYPDSAKTRAGLRQWAVAGQGVLLQSNDKANSRLNWSKLFRSDRCIRYMLNNFDMYLAITKKIKLQLLNTGLRLSAWAQASAQESGVVSSVLDPTAADCAFSLDELSN